MDIIQLNIYNMHKFGQKVAECGIRQGVALTVLQWRHFVYTGRHLSLDHCPGIFTLDTVSQKTI